MSPATLSNSHRSFTSIGWSSRKFCAASPCITRPANRCRKRWSKDCLSARQFNQGFATVEYASSALIDLNLHLEPKPEAIDIVEFEKQQLDKLGMPGSIVMRHRTPHFQHIFSGDSYSAGYYSYLWSEVLDADGFGAFEESGDIFDPETASRLETYVYSAGYSRDPEEAYKRFRGSAARPEPLLRKRGLMEAPRGA